MSPGPRGIQIRGLRTRLGRVGGFFRLAAGGDGMAGLARHLQADERPLQSHLGAVEVNLRVADVLQALLGTLLRLAGARDVDFLPALARFRQDGDPAGQHLHEAQKMLR